jgi:hypothetical protein
MGPRIAVCMLLSCVLTAATAAGREGSRHLDMKARVLDILFPLDVEPTPYFLKMTLRFGDSPAQLVIVEYPGGKSELIRYELNKTGAEFSQLIAGMVAENPEVTEQQIAARLTVAVSRSPISDRQLEKALSQLKSIRISPVLASREAVDEYSQYEFWFDTWLESVHYALDGPFHSDTEDKLVQWMIKFRTSVHSLPMVSPTRNP